MTHILKGNNLTRVYNKRSVVRDVTIHLCQGEVVGLLGPNGAGKTTTFYMLVGIISPTRGRIFLDEQDITPWPLFKRARAGISYLPQESSVFKKLSVEDNLKIILEFTDLSPQEQRERLELLLSELGIEKLARQRASLLSGGERRRLEIARALIRKPIFVLLDEPFAGIDPLAIIDIQEIVARLKRQDIGVLISDHNVRDTMTICDRIYLLYDGRIILEGTPEEIASSDIARKLYLGENFRL